MLHTSCEPFLLITQYRPPHYGEISSIDSLEDELNIFSLDVFGTIMIGDFNVHNKQWLKFSSHDSPEGYALQQLCQRQGFCNYVNSPIRGQHLLDLVLSDLTDCVYCQVLLPISDHNLVFTELSVNYEIVANQSRSVFDYKSAHWRGLRHFLANKN